MYCIWNAWESRFLSHVLHAACVSSVSIKKIFEPTFCSVFHRSFRLHCPQRRAYSYSEGKETLHTEEI